ncbi:protein LURP-one-related 8-like [Phalaenopsis equestris]|uniref:protein LURP-one-related 8-like n=1 Tax=Phalaenopsis equestris TaxID=78828 RepID=UPI0009E29183|nr:protein LURP-one-related 8-like [Phalaenopsis equestris]
MTKIYPNSPTSLSPAVDIAVDLEPSSFTVWRKSLLFNCSGFTVFDAKGNLAFRVDNYSFSNRTEIVLMDTAGNSVFTVRRKKLTLVDHWHIFEGEVPALRRRFSARKHLTLLPSKVLAHVKPSGGEKGPIYCVEGSFSHRSCVVYDEQRRPVLEIRRKEAIGGVAFGGDVFRLIVHPGFDSGLAMTIVILLEQMFGSRAAPIRG